MLHFSGVNKERNYAMRKFGKTMIITTILILTYAIGAYAWEVEYDASSGLLPTEASPAWQSNGTSEILDGVLRIPGSGAKYSREVDAISAGVPVTMEARMCVQSAMNGSASLAIGTYSGYIPLSILSNRIVTGDVYNQTHEFWMDFTTLHTIRLAYDGNTEAHVWVDDQLALSWEVEPWPWSIGLPEGVSFGSYSTDSYWQYVAYSKEYLPVPEPSSLAALAFGILPIGVTAIRKRRLLK